MAEASRPQSEALGRFGTRPQFVGRDAELRALNDALELALSGVRQVVLVGGEPGIGKTQTLVEFAREARERGASVLWGNCYEWEGAPAYWPWTQGLSSWLHELDDAALSEILGPHGSWIVQIVPEIQTRLPSMSPPPSLEAEARRFQLHTAVARVLRNAARERALVFVLDDVHWADLPTLRLLLFLAQGVREGRLIFVAAFREAEVGRPHPGASILADLAREPHSRRLSLIGLPKAQVAHLVTLITGKAQSPGLVQAVYAETEGNPFFVTEVARLLAEEGQLEGSDNTEFRRSHVPDSVREAIRRRLDHLSDDCNRALEVGAVIGRDFDLRVLARATGTPSPDLLDVLDEAIRARLITAGEEPGKFRFSHALVQATLYEETATAERARLHLAVGEALEQDGNHGQAWAELAHHFYHANPLGPPEKVLRFSANAGDAAMSQFAWRAASVHFQHALAALDQVAPSDTGRRCDLLLALGEVQNHLGSGAGDAPEARASFLRAFELAETLGDGERMARAAVGYAGHNIVAAFGGSRQLELLEAALSRLDPVDSPLRVRVLARLAMDLWYRSTDNLERSQAFAEEAVAAAQRLKDPTLLSYALNGRHNSGHRPTDLAERIADAQQLVAIAEQTGDPIAAAWGHMLYAMDTIEAGNLFAADESARWLRRFDERVHIPYIATRVAVYQAELDLLVGRYADAAQRVERARGLWQSSMPRQHAAQSFILLRDLGRLDLLTEEIELPDHLHAWRVSAQAHRMALALERRQILAARAEYEALVEDDFAHVSFNQHWFSTLALLAEAAIAFNDTSRAARLGDWLAPYTDRLVYDGSAAVRHGPVALYAGRLAGFTGRWDDAAAWLDQSLATCERLGLRPYVARTLLAQAELAIWRDGPGNRLARELADRAIQEAEAIGMLGLIPGATSLRDATAISPYPAFGLTRRELEVLRLVALGLTDAEVAERLFLSPRTVGTHLTSIYTKLNVSSRAAATRMAIEQGLI